MKKDIMQKIDFLVEMSGTTNTYETLNEELVSLNQEIDKQKAMVRDLKKSITDNKYLNANERLIDENIKIGIENRLYTYQQDLEELEKEILDFSVEEESVHADIVSLEKEEKQLKHFLESLELKMKTIGEKDPNVYSFYDSLIAKTIENIQSIEKKLANKKSNYTKITNKMEQLGVMRFSLEEKIAKEKENLKSVKDTLANPNSYIDYKARKHDEAAVDQYIEELEVLERKRLEILTDPAYIGHEAKTLYMDDDKTSSLDKVKELVTIIQSKPYMNVAFKDLDELLEEAITKRDELANTIENKTYAGDDLSVIELRIQYLEEKKDKLLKDIEDLKSNIANIDLVLVKDLFRDIDLIKSTRERLNEDIEVYKKVISENEEQKSPKKKASLKSALKRKQDELLRVESVLESFEHDLEELVIKSKHLEENDLLEMQNEITELEKEIILLKKYDLMDSHSKDILEVEKDKESLKELSDNVQNIMSRKKYSQTATEIYDEIELIYGTDEDLLSESIKLDSDPTDLDEYHIETSTNQEHLSEEFVLNEPTLIEPEIKEETLQDEEESSENNENVENRFKVIRVEEIEEKDSNNESVESLPEEFVLSDLKEADYISFNDLLNGDKDEN